MLNYSTSAAGGVIVEILDEYRKPIPGFSMEEGVELYGDEVEAETRWKNGSDISRLSAYA